MSGLLPCATCPWRVDQDASVIPRYSHDKACVDCRMETGKTK